MEKPMLEYALEYAGRGWPVFPLHTPKTDGGCSCDDRKCSHIGKHPRTTTGFKEATTAPEQIREWWNLWPDANIGIATGHGLLVVDFDIDHEKGKYGDETLTLLQEEHEELPDTVMALSGGGGLHYYFHCTADDLTINQEVLPGMDFRGNGGYVAAPPSLHASGRRYEWEAAHDPEDMELAELPVWLYDILKAGKGGKKNKRFEAPETITEGGRNGTMFRMASSLRAKGLSEAAIIAAVWEENQLRCKPPLSRREIETICGSVGKYEPGDSLNRIQNDVAAEEKIAGAVMGDWETLTDEAVLTGALQLSDPVERESRLAELRGRAKELKRSRDFERVLKAYQEKLAKAAAQRAAEEDPAVIDLPGCPLPGLKCFGWNVDKHGVTRTSTDIFSPGEEEACSHPIVITERLTNIDTSSEKVKLSFYRDGRWKDLIVDKSTIASRQKIIELADAGIQVNSENAKLLIQYLHDLEAQNGYRIPRKRCVSRLGWAGKDFVPYVDDVQYDGDQKYAAYFNAVSCAGDYDAWKKSILEARGKSHVFRVALAACFASPLMWPLGAQTFFVHLWGGTEVGKSVAQMAAMSVWGNPDMGALLRSYNSTPVAIERMAGFCHSIPLALDEQQTAKNNRFFNMDALIYNICEGQGKGRGTKAGSLENMATWRLCVLSSGEEPLTTSKSGAGGINRVLGVQCRRKIFDDAPGIADLVKSNYGHAGKAYIAGISNQGVLKEAKERWANYRKIITSLERSTDKQAASAAMLVVGDYYASTLIFGMGKEAAEHSAVAFCSTLADMLASVSEVSQVERAYRWACDWVVSNPGRFERQQTGGLPYHDDRNQLWGKQTENGFLIIASVLEDALAQAGYSVDACKAEFVERGYFIPGKSRPTKQRRLNGSKNGIWCYELVMPSLTPEALEADDAEEDPWDEGNNTIPFPGSMGRV